MCFIHLSVSKTHLGSLLKYKFLYLLTESLKSVDSEWSMRICILMSSLEMQIWPWVSRPVEVAVAKLQLRHIWASLHLFRILLLSLTPLMSGKVIIWQREQDSYSWLQLIMCPPLVLEKWPPWTKCEFWVVKKRRNGCWRDNSSRTFAVTNTPAVNHLALVERLEYFIEVSKLCSEELELISIPISRL